MKNRNIFMARKKEHGLLPTGKKLKPLRKFKIHKAENRKERALQRGISKLKSVCSTAMNWLEPGKE